MNWINKNNLFKKIYDLKTNLKLNWNFMQVKLQLRSQVEQYSQFQMEIENSVLNKISSLKQQRMFQIEQIRNSWNQLGLSLAKLDN